MSELGARSARAISMSPIGVWITCQSAAKAAPTTPHATITNAEDLVPSPDLMLEFGDRVGVMAKREEVQIKVFLVADAVYCACKGQKTPEGYYNIERMVQSLARRGRVAT